MPPLAPSAKKGYDEGAQISIEKPRPSRRAFRFETIMAEKFRIPLAENDAVSLLGRVKPTAAMPRQGAHPTKPKDKKKIIKPRTKRAK